MYATNEARTPRPKAPGLSACLLLLWIFSTGASRPESAHAQPPASPVWPAPMVVDAVGDTLLQYYAQRANGTTPSFLLAPRFESEKSLAAKDPDTLWEFHGGAGTSCHGASSQEQFLDCAGYRLANTFGRYDYTGGLGLFDASRGYYANDAYARIAAHYAIYHAFVHEQDATIAAGQPYNVMNARDAQDYHRSMVRAYEAHAREIVLRMFRETRADAAFQMSLTRAIGQLETIYLPLISFLEEHDAWGANRDRRNAFAIVNAMNQRIFWEWIWTQTNGPATAGFVNLGSQATYDSSRPNNGILDGTDHFRNELPGGPEDIPSLRSAANDDPGQGGIDGLWFDSDYPTPGEWWCYATFGAGASPALSACLEQAAREARPGSQSAPGPFSPYGQYYGDTGLGNPCDGRAYVDSGHSCGDTNLGSIAEEWLWTFGGARSGLYLIERLGAANDPDLPVRALGLPSQRMTIGLSGNLTPYEHATQRVGYGVAGFHGGAGRNDDMEWTWSADGNVRAVRTLSAGTQDGQSQNGRVSVGEGDVPPGTDPSHRVGNTWIAALGYQEYPGAIENHAPGPSSLYGTALLGLVLGDKPADRARSMSGLADSHFDAQHRNHIEEFQSWIWLLQSSYYRCPPPGGTGDDPAVAACFDFNAARRHPLWVRPSAVSPSIRFDYLFRDKDPSGTITLIDPSVAADADATCGGRAGNPWRPVYDRSNGAAGPYFHDEAGFGAYNELVQGMGGAMRLTAERYAEGGADPNHVAERAAVLKPWYDLSHSTVLGIFATYAVHLGYVPDIENSSCMGINPDPMDPTPAMISWQQGTGASVQSTTVRRAMWYGIAATWYWWYAADWLATGE